MGKRQTKQAKADTQARLSDKDQGNHCKAELDNIMVAQSLDSCEVEVSQPRVQTSLGKQ